MRLILFLFLLLVPGAAAHAEWLRSSSAHFVVYANDSERNIRLFSQQLERYNSAMSALTGIKNPAPSPSNRVTVYVVRDADQVREILGQKGTNIAGVYFARAGGSLAIIPRVSAASSGDDVDQSMQIMLHEYAHHFLISQGGFPLPRWMSEGGAEFYAQATFDADGGVGIGRPAHGRVVELHNLEDLGRDIVSVKELIDPALYDKRKDKVSDAFYAKSWALYHYLMFNPSRRGQRARYVQLMTEGKKSPDAAREAFGDLETLDHEVSAYASKGTMTAIKLPASMLQTGPVEVSKLSAGEAEMMMVHIRSQRGVTKTQAQELLPQVRAIAARYPADAAVLSALAEAEYDAGNDAQALTAAVSVLRVDQSQINAHYQLIMALMRMADKDSDKKTAFDTARTAILALNRREPDNPLPMVYFFQSYIRQGIDATPVALQGLERAAMLAPFDLPLRLSLALQQIKNKEPDKARDNLMAVAFNPHSKVLADAASKIMDRLRTDPGWDGSDAKDPLTEQAKQGG